MRTIRRRLMGEPPTLHYFHGVADPYSHLAAQLLPALAAAYGLRVVPHLVPAPAAEVAPEPERLLGWSIRDAGQLAAAHGLAFPADARAPAADAVRAAEGVLAGLTDPAAFSEAAFRVGTALWRGQPFDAPTRDAQAALAEGAAALAKAGHYLPGVFAFEGECYWGVDRLPHLEARLADLRQSPPMGPPVVRQLEASDRRGDVRRAPLEFFLSFRSPYTHIAAARVRALADRWNAELLLRPVLPMVMRGLPVPLEKRMYIVRDTKREADRLGLPFGRICDPVGTGVERGLAVLHRAIALGRGPDFVESFLQGAFAEGVDATTDAGLLGLAERTGLSAADVQAALADESWRAIAEQNRERMFGLGLWGVPAFRVGNLPAHWGQDRLWAVEQDLGRIAGGIA
ncbi:2-hydroxychromene-2-carboxylate isomerase [Sandaracinobacter neustonicus]|uniref:2-hydroxychromene-2-carboxylate isomerase n=1 Tax=Sandaracinobacter neustonicus TaxID=1715348 RepID=A0A501XNA1_9SPHN|nr:2-hydroxychromene-2-carboxylate isomerase [Sandaracinobacter neustonicus]